MTSTVSSRRAGYRKRRPPIFRRDLLHLQQHVSVGEYPRMRPSRILLKIAVSLAPILLLAGCSSASPASSDSADTAAEFSAPQQEAYMLQQAVSLSFNVTTTSFKETGFLQIKFTCEGTDSSPHIAWGEVPSNTQSIAVVSEDLDLAGAVASHWIVWGLPPDTLELPAGASGSSALPTDAVEGVNTYDKPGYKGPCPPPKVRARSTGCRSSGFQSNPYRWSVYAVEKELSLGPDATRDDLLQAIDGGILASGSIDVKYISKILIPGSYNQTCR